MSQRGPLPYLEWCGVEVANAARTVEYLRAGLGDGEGGSWELGEGDPCSVLYRIAGKVPSAGGGIVTTSVLPLFTLEDIAGQQFVDPATDGAPWYDPAEPGSTSFLGLILTDLEGYGSTVRRARGGRGRVGGGTFGAEQRDVREWTFTGSLISGDDLGAEYGLRWLRAVLAAPQCDLCDTCDMTVRIACPSEELGDDTVGEWISYDAALVEGPRPTGNWAPQAGDRPLAGCRTVVDVEFTLVAGNPYLYKRAATCLEETPLGSAEPCESISGAPGMFAAGGAPVAGQILVSSAEAQPAVCCPVSAPSRGQVLGAVFTIRSGSGMGPLFLEAYEECPGSGTDEVPVLQMALSQIPSNSTVVVDGALHEVTITTVDAVTGYERTDSGLYLVQLPSGRSLEWPEVRDCDVPGGAGLAIGCLCARPFDPCSGGGDTTIEISTRIREG